MQEPLHNEMSHLPEELRDIKKMMDQQPLEKGEPSLDHLLSLGKNALEQHQATTALKIVKRPYYNLRIGLGIAATLVLLVYVSGYFSIKSIEYDVASDLSFDSIFMEENDIVSLDQSDKTESYILDPEDEFLLDWAYDIDSEINFEQLDLTEIIQ